MSTNVSSVTHKLLMQKHKQAKVSHTNRADIVKKVRSRIDEENILNEWNVIIILSR